MAQASQSSNPSAPQPIPSGGTGSGNGKFLIIGVAPDLVDFTDPTIPKGLTPADIQKGLEAAQADIAAIGASASLCMITNNPLESNALIQGCLTNSTYEGIIIGNAIRSGLKSFSLFEMVMNIVNRKAPNSKIGFNQSPKDSAEVAKRIAAKFY